MLGERDETAFELLCAAFDATLARRPRFAGRLLAALRDAPGEWRARLLGRVGAHESYLKALEAIEAAGAALADAQPFLFEHFAGLIRQTAAMGKEPSSRRIKIVANYLRRLQQDGVVSGETLARVWEVCRGAFPTNSAAHKDVREGFAAVLKL